MPGLWLLVIQYALAQPLFIYNMCYITGNTFKKADWVAYVASMVTIIIGMTLVSVAGGFVANYD